MMKWIHDEVDPRDRPQRIRVSERPRRKEPPQFKGDTTEFRMWWNTIEEHLEYAKGDFETDPEKISWVGGFCRDKALAWHQNRRENFKFLELKDEWDLYVEAIKKRFTDTYEVNDHIRQMEELKYSGDISDYLTQMRALNIRARLAGPIWKRTIKKRLGKELFTRFTMMEQPDDDDDFERRLEAVGKGMEEGNREAKALELGAATVTREAKDSRKDKGKDREGTGPSKGDKPDKKGNKPERSDNRERKTRNSSSGKVIWTDKKEALKGIPKEDVDDRAAKGQCLRCAYDNHAWAQCRRREPLIGELPKRSSATKRKAVDEPIEDSSSSKKAKTSETVVATTSAVRDNGSREGAGSSSGRRIFEISSDDEDMEDF
jgi:hypothetical protein